MSECQLRQFWADLLPTVSDPAALLDITDRDDRAVVVLLKTLYVVFKGVLEERHRLRCGDRHASPASPEDLVPPSPHSGVQISQTKPTCPTSVAPASISVSGPARPAVLVPETVDVRPPRADRPPLPVAETAPLPPPPAVWAPETLETSPRRPGRRPPPVAETVPPPRTPPHTTPPSDAVSPVLPGLSPASRRARRAAGRAGVPSGSAREEATSPACSLDSPLLLPQRPPVRLRGEAAPEPHELEASGGTAKSDQKQSRLSRSKHCPTGPGEPSGASPQTPSSAGKSRQKRKYVVIGRDEPMPPRRPRVAAASPNKAGQMSGPARLSRSPIRPSSGVSASSSTRASARGAPPAPSQQGRTHANLGSPPKKRSTKAGPPPEGQAERAGAGTSGRQKASPSGESSVVELDVLLGELSSDGERTEGEGAARDGGGGQGGGDEERCGTRDGRKKQRESPTHGADRTRQRAVQSGQAGAAVPSGHQTSPHESQEETQLDSLLFAERRPAGPTYKYDAGPVRRQADRQKLPGWSCSLCREWYADREMTEDQLREHMNRCSRHRHREPPPPDTPPEFWDPVDFPPMDTTQYGGRVRTSTRRKL